MHAPPVPKLERVDNVLLQLRTDASCLRGHLILTSHHLTFHPAPTVSTAAPPPPPTPPPAHPIPHALIARATRLPSLRPLSPNGSPGSRIYPIAFHTKDFDACALGFATEAAQADVFESVRHCAVLVDASQLFAFYYQPRPPPSPPQPPAKAPLAAQGWSIYDAKREFARQGLGSRTKAWRLTDINAQYDFCPSYPALMAVPSRISDATLGYASKYRSKARIPALSYLHWANHGSITRSSQPMVGLKNARSIQDEKLIEAIFTSHHFADPDSMAAKAAAEATANAGASGGVSTLAVYGATSTNLIVDARPTTNAMANVARGAGTENMEYYKGCKKTYLGIDNIHVMRDSLNRLTDALRESEPPATFGLPVEAAASGEGGSEAAAAAATSAASPLPIDPHALRRSSWLKHISALLEGTMTIARNVHINSSHVLVHCSDGWDRTSQLAALAELCLDPYYRTFDGFAVLIEKDWLSFGHRFAERGGYKSNDKFFVTSSRPASALDDDERPASDGGSDTEGDRAAGGNGAGAGATTTAGAGAGQGGGGGGGGGGFDGQAAANAFWGFTKQLTANFSAATSSSSAQQSGPHRGSHIKETSPVFHQFLDCIWQIMRQCPKRFEFGQDFLVEVLRASQECQYGTFLMDCERERLAPRDDEGRALPPLPSRTVSAWDHLLSESSRQRFRNPQYEPELDERDPKRTGTGTDMGVLFVDPRDVRYFERLFKRDGQEMNAALEREADERRRARERLERAVRGESVTTPPVLAEGDANGNGGGAGTATVAVVGPGDRDPVLDAVGVNGIGAAVSQAVAPTNGGGSAQQPLSASPSFGPGSTGNPPGAVDLSRGKVDPSQLGYQVRKSKTVPRSAMSPSSSHASLASASGGGTGNAVDGGDAVGGAGDAANRMKNLFLGGWGRLQDAVGGSVPPSSQPGAQQHARPSPPSQPPSRQQQQQHQAANPWEVTGGAGIGGPLGQLGGPAARAAPAAATASSMGPAASTHNPWASNTDWRREMELEQQRIGGRGTGPTRMGAAGGPAGLGSQPVLASASASAMGTPGADDEDKKPLDPLGVL